jgi:hypothetical protein
VLIACAPAVHPGKTPIRHTAIDNNPIHPPALNHL